MPYYDLRCTRCAKEFTLKASIRERTEGALICPECGSHELAAIFKSVNILHFKGKDCDACPGSAGNMPQGGCCGGHCSHQH